MYIDIYIIPYIHTRKVTDLHHTTSIHICHYIIYKSALAHVLRVDLKSLKIFKCVMHTYYISILTHTHTHLAIACLSGAHLHRQASDIEVQESRVPAGFRDSGGEAWEVLGREYFRVVVSGFGLCKHPLRRS